jgi:SAM-dependent methyltransferase
MDIFGLALTDYYQNKTTEILWLHNNYGEEEEMPVDVFFREQNDFPELENKALTLCRGSILDIGAGVGSHALMLQEREKLVFALELSAAACAIMQQRGTQNIINEDIFHYQTRKFDTLILLMNGIGLCGNLNGLKNFLTHAKSLLNIGGQLIFDSSDIAYLYEDIEMPEEKYYGEIAYQYEYKNQKGDWFNWLYIDQQTLTNIANEIGWRCEIIFEDDMDQYLAKLTPID